MSAVVVGSNCLGWAGSGVAVVAVVAVVVGSSCLDFAVVAAAVFARLP